MNPTISPDGQKPQPPQSFKRHVDTSLPLEFRLRGGIAWLQGMSETAAMRPTIEGLAEAMREIAACLDYLMKLQETGR